MNPKTHYRYCCSQEPPPSGSANSVPDLGRHLEHTGVGEAQSWVCVRSAGQGCRFD